MCCNINHGKKVRIQLLILGQISIEKPLRCPKTWHLHPSTGLQSRTAPAARRNSTHSCREVSVGFESDQVLHVGLCTIHTFVRIFENVIPDLPRVLTLPGFRVSNLAVTIFIFALFPRGVVFSSSTPGWLLDLTVTHRSTMGKHIFYIATIWQTPANASFHFTRH